MKRRRHTSAAERYHSRWMAWLMIAAWVLAVALAIVAGFTLAELFWAWVIRR